MHKTTRLCALLLGACFARMEQYFLYRHAFFNDSITLPLLGVHLKTEMYGGLFSQISKCTMYARTFI